MTKWLHELSPLTEISKESNKKSLRIPKRLPDAINQRIVKMSIRRVWRYHKSKDRQDGFEDTKEVIRCHKSNDRHDVYKTGLRIGTSFSTTDIHLYTVKIATHHFPFGPKVKVKGDNNHVKSFTLTIMTWLTITEYLCHKRPWIGSICHNLNPVLSYITYHQACNTMGATSGAVTAYPSGTPELTPVIVGVHVAQS